MPHGPRDDIAPEPNATCSRDLDGAHDASRTRFAVIRVRRPTRNAAFRYGASTISEVARGLQNAERDSVSARADGRWAACLARIPAHDGDDALSDNKAFAAWALFIVTGAAILVAALTTTGLTTLPDAFTLLQKIAMGLSVRAAYKWFGGWDWAEWSIAGDAVVASGEFHGPSDAVDALA
jgi:hypothetical protein